MKFDTLDECGPEILTNEAATRKLTDSEGTLMEVRIKFQTTFFFLEENH